MRRFTLLAHVVCSVGWLGAVVVFIALGATARVSDDEQLVRGALLAMDAAAWLVLVPFAVAAFATGVVQSLTTPWGLLRHYWVVFKLVLTAVGTVVLLLYTRTLEHFGGLARHAPTDSEALRTASPLIHSVGAFLLLTATTTLAVYKPRGMTRYGQRKQRQTKIART